MTQREEPICGFCYRQKIRQPLVFDTRCGIWECPICKTKSQTPAADESAYRQKLEEDRARDPGRWVRMVSGKKRSGSRSSRRRRKKPPKAAWRQRPETLV